MFTSLSAGPEVVAIPGPSVIPDRVLSAMHRAMPDIYAGELLDVTDEIFDTLSAIAVTESRGFVTISNGHGAWEMAITNTLSRGDRVLVLDCGRFATLWGDLAAFNGCQVEQLTAEAGRAVDAEMVEARLREDSDRTIAAVLMAHVDTASSARNDIAAVRAALDAADHPALLMVDAIASLGCERYEMDAWGVDVTVGASQKGLMTPPGLAFVWPGPRALDAHRRADLRTRYWDWTSRTEEGPHYLRYSGTPPVTHMFGLREALRMITEEGLEARWARHAALAGAVRAAVDAWSTPSGIGFHIRDSAERADSVTAVRTGEIDGAEVSALCRDRMGVTLGVGMADAGGSSFRIGHMGHVNAPMVLGVVGAIDAALGALGAEIGRSGVAAAAETLAKVLQREPCV